MIEIIPFDDIDPTLLSDISNELKIIFGKCKVSDTIEDSPKEAYDFHRNQYLSIPFINLMSEKALNGDGKKFIGITWADLFTDKFNFIFGQSQVRGKVCIISLKRLSPTFYNEKMDYQLLLDRSVKEAIHELWHCFGMRHCDDQSCVMTFSTNIDGVDNKSSSICLKCNDIRKKIHTYGP